MRTLSAFVIVLLAQNSYGQCPQWSTAFSGRSLDGPISVQYEWEGDSPALLIGGSFELVDTADARYVASWDGHEWSGFGDGPGGDVNALAYYDDGSGIALYAAGLDLLSRWDGTAWTSIPFTGAAEVLHVHDDGLRSTLYLGGKLTSVAGVSVSQVARYDGSWSALPALPGSTSTVLSMETHDDGAGPRLYIGGSFFHPQLASVANVARWEGMRWRGIDGGVHGPASSGPRVNALQSTVSPSGIPELHVGGKFELAGSTSVENWAIWSQGSWSDVGGASIVRDFTLRDEPAGRFVHAARVTAVERYDGAALTPLSLPGPEAATTISSWGLGPNDDLYVGRKANFGQSNRLESWNGSTWKAVFDGRGAAAKIFDLASMDLGSGPTLIASGDFVGHPRSGSISVLQGTDWVRLGENEVYLFDGNFAQWNDDLVVSPASLSSGPGLPSDEFLAARFDGSRWHPLGAPQPGSLGAIGSAGVQALAVFDSGAGQQLIVGGMFDPNSSPFANLLVFDGTTWSEFAGGIERRNSTSYENQEQVTDMVVWDDGSGPALYVAGNFDTVGGGIAANNIARWDGTSWSALGQGLDSIFASDFSGPIVHSLAAFNSPTGPQLIAHGGFDEADGQRVYGIAAWDGTSWSRLGGANFMNHAVRLQAADLRGLGELLYVFGFGSIMDRPLQYGAVWDGGTWSQIPTFQSTDDEPGIVQASAVHATDRGRSLVVGGDFISVAGVPSASLALLSDRCGDVLGKIECTSLSNSTGLRGLLRANGSTSIADDDLGLVLRQLPPNELSLVLAAPAAGTGTIGSGLLCIGGGLLRLRPSLLTDGQGERTQAFDFGAPYASLALVGASVHFQCLYRDSAGAAPGFNTTDALRITFRP